MPNIYEENNKYYMLENNKYRLHNILIKRNTIILMPTEIYEELQEPIVYTYKELRDKLIKKN